MPLTSFSLEKYNEARRRLKELSSGSNTAGSSSLPSSRSTHAHDVDDEDEEQKVAILRDNTNSTSNSNSKNRNATKGKRRKDKGSKQNVSEATVSRRQENAPSEGDDDSVTKALAREVDDAREVLIGAIRTSGLRPARETGLLSALTRLERHQRAWVEALEDRADKWKNMSHSLRRRITESEERIAAAEHAVEDERREVMGKARTLIMEADVRRETESRVLREQMEEERQRMASEASRAREGWQQAKLKEMEQKMVRDLERTTARLMKESKAQVAGTIARLEDEYVRSCDNQEAKVEEAMAREEGALRAADELREERDHLEAELFDAKHDIKELKKRLASQQEVQAITSCKFEELEASFKEVIESMKQNSLQLKQRHEDEVTRLKEERAKELEEVDQRIRKSLATKDEAMLRLKAEAEEAKKDAMTARILLQDIYNGFRRKGSVPTE